MRSRHTQIHGKNKKESTLSPNGKWPDKAAVVIVAVVVAVVVDVVVAGVVVVFYLDSI